MPPDSILQTRVKRPETESKRRALSVIAAYDGILQGRERESHQKIGLTYEQIDADRLEEFYETRR